MSLKALLLLSIFTLYSPAEIAVNFDADIDGTNINIKESNADQLTVKFSKEIAAIIKGREEYFEFAPVSLVKEGDFTYFVFSIVVPTVPGVTEGMCAGGKEAYIVWNEIDTKNNEILLSVPVLYSSCIFSINTHNPNIQVTKKHIEENKLTLPIVETLPVEKLSYLVFKENEANKGFSFVEM